MTYTELFFSSGRWIIASIYFFALGCAVSPRATYTPLLLRSAWLIVGICIGLWFGLYGIKV